MPYQILEVKYFLFHFNKGFLICFAYRISVENAEN